MQIKESTDKFDVIIVGSGAGGGMATKILSEAGLSVAVVEAGPYYDPADPKDMTQLKPTWESPRRGARTTRAFGDFDAAYGGWEIKGEPYTRAPGTKFDWFRSRMLGGRTNKTFNRRRLGESITIDFRSLQHRLAKMELSGRSY